MKNRGENCIHFCDWLNHGELKEETLHQEHERVKTTLVDDQ